MQDFIKVGRIVKAHGIKGELLLEYKAASTDLLQNSVFLDDNRLADGKNLLEYKLCSVRLHHGRPLIQLETVPDRTSAECLRGCSVFIPKNRLPEAGENEVYLGDLPGLSVLVQAEDETVPEPLGCITAVDEVAGQEIWTIQTPGGQQILFPAAREFVLEIDLGRQTARIAPPPGLLEIYLK